MGTKYKEEIINTKTQSQNSGDGDRRDFRDNMDSKDNKDNMDNKNSKGNKEYKDGFDNNILACRCMEISENAVREAIRQGATTVDAVKRATMAGMGLCQSKTCFNIIARLISEEAGIPVSQIRPMKIRIPVRPVKISSLDMEI